MKIQNETRSAFEEWWSTAKKTLKCDDYDAFEIWQASTQREGFKLVLAGDYAELVRSNRYKHEQNIELSKEVKILRERKKFYKSELNNMRCKYKVMPIEPTDEILEFIGGSKQEATMIYKAVINLVKPLLN